MQFLLKLQQPCCHTADSGWGVPQSKITATKEDTAQKAPERTEAEKGLFCFLPGGKFSFVVSPSRVQSQNSRTTLKKRLPRQQGKSGWGSRKKGESKQRAGTGETFTAERLAHTPTTRLMQEAEGRGSYYVVDYNGQKKGSKFELNKFRLLVFCTLKCDHGAIS